jgi:predicted NBD/HSP70 family sugar kinase
MYLSFDIGGTKMRIAASKDGKSFIGEPHIVNTPENFEEGIELLHHTAMKCCEECAIDGAAGGIAGTLDKTRSSVIAAPNLPQNWIGKPFKESLAKVLNTAVYIENDTAIVGLGETHFGAGERSGIEIYITVSTGVNGVRIVDGRIDRSTFGFEIGHQVIDLDGSVCKDCSPCRNCSMIDFESMISGSATERRFGKKPYDISQDDILWDELAGWLAIGLRNTILHWSPDRVILGGSMIVGDPAIPISKVEELLRKTLTAFPVIPEIRKATLGSIGGLYGGLAYLKEHAV